jgi:hypothetical protein
MSSVPTVQEMKMCLEQVEAGDLLIQNSGHPKDRQVVSVDRVTKTQIIIGPYRYRKRTGKLIGGGTWNRMVITVPKHGEVSQVQRMRLHDKLSGQILNRCQPQVVREMSLDQVKRLSDLLQVIHDEKCTGCCAVHPDVLKVCPRCGGVKCTRCDMGDHIPCKNCPESD